MIVSFAVRTTGTAVGTAAWEIRTDANTRPDMLEMACFISVGTASTFGIGKPAAIGVTPTAPVDFLPEDPSDPLLAGHLQSALAWATGPTAPANFFRRFNFGAAVGSGIIVTFPKGLTIPLSNSMVLWNITATVASDAWAVCDA